MRNMGRFVLGAALLAAFGVASAQDVHNLSENLPTSIEDAYPTPVGERQLQLFFAYDTFNDVNVFTFEPTVRWGLTEDFEASVSLPFFWNEDDSNLGDVRLRVLWGPKAQNDPDLAFALVGEVDIPTNTDDNEDDDEVDTRLKLILTQPLDQGPSHDRLHLNITWLNSSGDSEGVEYGIGYSRLLDPSTAFVADIVRLDPEGGDSVDAIELGVRRQFQEMQTWALGLRFGLGDNPLDFGITASWQTKF